MFGVPGSIKILLKLNSFVKKHKFKKNYKIIITPPYTLIDKFVYKMENSQIHIGAQNCFYKDNFSSDTGAISAYMIKNLRAKYIIIGHSDNRAEGDDNYILKQKVTHALRNNLKVIFCIGENKRQKQNKQTLNVLNSQLKNVLSQKIKQKNLIIAYEPIWSIGTGVIPSSKELEIITKNLKKILRKLFKSKEIPPIIYGGSVEGKNIKSFRTLRDIDGFLIGGASKSSQKFIDILKNYYR